MTQKRLSTGHRETNMRRMSGERVHFFYYLNDDYSDVAIPYAVAQSQINEVCISVKQSFDALGH